MKKHQIVAAMGTLTLVANLLLPSMALGAQNQTGNVSVDCTSSSPDFTIVPATTFNFYTDGVSTNPTVSSSSTSDVFSNAAGALTYASDNRVLEVNDPRDFRSAGCNNLGLKVTLEVQDGADGDGKVFESNNAAAGGTSLTLDNLLFVTSGSGTPGAGYYNSNGVNYTTGTICGTSASNAPCSSATTATYNLAGTGFATYANFPGTNTLGTTNTNSTPYDFTDDTDTPSTAKTLLGFPAASNALFGNAGLGTVFALRIPQSFPAGSYNAKIVYTVVPTN